MTVFVDTSAWFASANAKDRHHHRASELLLDQVELVTSTFVLVETWLLLQSKIGFIIYRFGPHRRDAFEVLR